MCLAQVNLDGLTNHVRSAVSAYKSPEASSAQKLQKCAQEREACTGRLLYLADRYRNETQKMGDEEGKNDASNRVCPTEVCVCGWSTYE